ncbi:MAG: hypothetical protein LAO05_11225 [Acidobacteriia bacterium]|nr:hypothetical protein [Terriglobia bacterium]
MNEQVLLVLDRAGGRWGLANEAVRSLSRRDSGYLIATGQGTIAADHVLEVAARLPVRPAGAVVGHYWPEPCLGMAVHEGVPVVVVSPSALPSALRGRRRESSHATRE